MRFELCATLSKTPTVAIYSIKSYLSESEAQQSHDVVELLFVVSKLESFYNLSLDLHRKVSGRKMKSAQTYNSKGVEQKIA